MDWMANATAKLRLALDRASPARPRLQLKHVALVIADIGGYTRFIRLEKATLLHAQEIISQLLEAVVDGASFPLKLNKLEGDAVFLYAEMGEPQAAAARDIARQVTVFFSAFHAKAGELAHSRAGCPCGACRHIQDLSLKVILHNGVVAVGKVRQFEELTGEDVILAHRLLKNRVSQPEYILMSASFHRLAGNLAGYSCQCGQETYDELGSINTVVFLPSRSRAAQWLEPCT